MSTDNATVDIRDDVLAPLVSYQGVPGAFGESAIHRAWARRARPHPTPTFEAALEALCTGVVERAVIPVWNSSTGPVPLGCRALDAYEARVDCVAEVEIPVRLCLIGHAEASVDDVRYVGSHPTALAQCKRLFAERSTMTPCDAFNTAGAVGELARYAAASRHATWYSALPIGSRRELAAIASEQAARHYGLRVLLSDVHDDPSNRTRFVVLKARRDVAAFD